MALGSRPAASRYHPRSRTASSLTTSSHSDRSLNCEFTISVHPELPSYRDRFELHEPTARFEGGSAKRRQCLEPPATVDFRRRHSGPGFGISSGRRVPKHGRARPRYRGTGASTVQERLGEAAARRDLSRGSRTRATRTYRQRRAQTSRCFQSPGASPITHRGTARSVNGDGVSGSGSGNRGPRSQTSFGTG